MSEQRITLRLIISSQQAGVIIGRGGENIKSLRNETGTQISISTPANSVSDQTRIIKITGATENITNCARLICKKWEQNGEDKVNIKVIVPSSQCSALIGKSGTNIKKLRESSGASIHIPSENLQNSTEKGISISGTSNATIDAIFGICSSLVNNPMNARNIAYDPNAPQMIRATDVSPQMIRGLSPGDVNLMIAQEKVIGLTRIVETLSGGTVIGKQLVPKNKFSSSTEIIKDEISVSSDVIGCLIGKGGSTISEIRQLSDCSIRILNGGEENTTSNKSGQKNVAISGDKESVAVAKSLINLTIDLNNMKRARGSAKHDTKENRNHQIPETNPWENYASQAKAMDLITYPGIQPQMLMRSGIKRESGHGYAAGNNCNDMQFQQYKKFRPNGQ